LRKTLPADGSPSGWFSHNKQNEPGVAIRNAGLLREDVAPCRLRIVENERDELHFFVFLRGFLHRLRHRGAAGGVVGGAEECEEVAAEEKTENQKDDGAADSDRPAAQDHDARRQIAERRRLPAPCT